MHPCKVWWRGIEYPSSEHAFVASKIEFTGKLSSILHRIKVAKIKSPGDAKKYGKTVTLAPNWKEEQVEIMREIVWNKFEQNHDLAKKLLNTGDAELVEGNTWHDYHWGVCNGQGQNQLGIILMEVRDFLPEYWNKMAMIAEAEFCGG
jgi:ribA/ribD-fused uncharacterized protein